MNMMNGFAIEPLEVVEADPTTAECRMLLAAHDYFVATRRSPAHCEPLSAAELKASGARFFVARHNGQIVGCGAVAGEGEEREVSRIYTVEAARHQRVAYRLIAEIEREAREAGARKLQLEAGRWQTEALEFFERAGFEQAPPFGRFREADESAISASLFYEKDV